MRYNSSMKLSPKLLLIISVVSVLLVSTLLYLYLKNQTPPINSFDDCAKYYPVMESYPRRCNTPDGRSFTETLSPTPTPTPTPVDDTIACTMEALLCPDGSYVGRVPPSCEFAPCP